MKQEDIIRMAREAGFSEQDAMGRPAFLGNSYDLQRFAALVEQRVARECAELCDAITYEGYVPPEDGGARDYYDSASQDCADAIRAKFLTKEEGK